MSAHLTEAETMAEFSGRLTHAPISYVVCEIRFSAVLKMVDYMPAIQESLREKFPRFRRETVNTLDFSAGAGGLSPRSEERWVLNDAAETNGYVIRQAAFVYHTTAYTEFEDFLRATLGGFEVLATTTKLSFIERVGLRYVDLITPDREESSSAYLQPGLTGLSLGPLGLQQDSMQQFTNARTDSGRLYLRVSSGIHTQSVPGDMLPLTLKARTPPAGRQTTLVDTDHFSENGFPFDLSRLELTIQQLRGPVRQVFRAAITPYALERWK